MTPFHPLLPMRTFGLILALIVVGLAAWAGWTYATTEGKLRDIASPLDPPGPVKAWSAEKVARAVATVALH